MSTSQLAFYDESAQGWQRALYAFLGEKQRRSGSRRSTEGYSRMSIVISNLCDALERPGIQASPPRGLSAEEIRRLLAAIAGTTQPARHVYARITITCSNGAISRVLKGSKGQWQGRSRQHASHDQQPP